MKRGRLAIITGLCMLFFVGMLTNSAQVEAVSCGGTFATDASAIIPEIACSDPWHMHQLSKELELENSDCVKYCELGSHGTCQTVGFKHALIFAVRENDPCDETCGGGQCGDNCGKCGIPDNSKFRVEMTTIMKKNAETFCLEAGFHRGEWILCDPTNDKISGGKISGVNGVKPSHARPYTTAWDGPFCSAASEPYCYLPDHILGCIEWNSGVIRGNHRGDFCPPDNVNPALSRKAQIKACYEGDLNGIFADNNTDDDCDAAVGSTLRLEGVVFFYEQ